MTVEHAAFAALPADVASDAVRAVEDALYANGANGILNIQASNSHTGNAIADLLIRDLPLADYYELDHNQFTLGRWNDIEFYGNDTWKVNPRVTLTAGLRWSNFPAAHSDNDQVSNYILSLYDGTNPLSGSADFRRLLLAHGLRNPFRMEIDQLTGSLYIGDVGQNAVEEVDEYAYPSVGNLPLVNFGWPWREGNQAYQTCAGTQPAATNPIAAVPQAGSGWLAAMSGPRYRNQTGGQFNFGASYDGSWFYFVHSYHAAPAQAEHIAGETDYGARFTCAVSRDNIFATQFHPEKSATLGLALYRNFLLWNP